MAATATAASTATPTEDANKPPPAPPSNLPPYPEMILGAIAALDEKDGSNKSAIFNYLEDTYGDQLPSSHSSLLTAHLARMKESGELLFIKNNYVRPGPDAPPKRGRGRPPKPKPDVPAGTVVAAPAAPARPRGRPRKEKDPLSVAVAKATSGLPRRRGRPPKKVARPAEAAAPAPAAATGSVAVTGVKRGRGRPPKAKPVLANEGQAA